MGTIKIVLLAIVVLGVAFCLYEIFHAEEVGDDFDDKKGEGDE